MAPRKLMIASLVFLVLCLFSAVILTDKTRSNSKITLCQSTDYKETCVKSLETIEEISDMGFVLRAVLYSAIEGARKAIAATSIAVNPTTTSIDICRELLEFSIDDFKLAFQRLGHVVTEDNKDQLQSDIMTSLSGSITFHQTCIDEIKNMNIDRKVVQSLKLSRKLSSNALALAMSTDMAFKKDDHTVGLPSWVMNEGKIKKATKILVVSKDGSGMFKTINEALSEIAVSIHNHAEKKFVIRVKAGVYEEYVEITKKMKNVVLIGDGPMITRITGNRSVKHGFTTFRTATLIVNGDNFVMKNIAISNTAGAINSQAVALRISGDKSVVYNSHIDGFQDTLYAHAHRQFYRDCTISGTVDFIFGDAAAVFQNCKIVVKRPEAGHGICTITAQGRSDKRSSTGFVLQNCTITSDKTYSIAKKELTSFLGRPWRKYSRTMVMESQINDLIDPRGWSPWSGEENLNTLWYGEFHNRGLGSDLNRRVKWLGFHKNISIQVAEEFVPRQFIDGNTWIPKRIPYFPDLTMPNYLN